MIYRLIFDSSKNRLISGFFNPKRVAVSCCCPCVRCGARKPQHGHLLGRCLALGAGNWNVQPESRNFFVVLANKKFLNST
jgi:hypothetical protein